MHASIDIGTNSVLLLVGEALPDGEVRAVADLMRVTRLGENLFTTGSISPDAAARTLEALKYYAETCRQMEAGDIVAAGTAAVRTASNGGEFLEKAREILGVPVEVLTEERESALSFAASARSFGNDIVVCDIGGGSTEFTAPGGDGNLVCSSLRLGCVSLTERFLKSDPETNEEIYHLRREVRERLEAELDPEIYSRPHDRAFVAAAGTASTLMSMKLELSGYDPERIHGSSLSLEALRDLIDKLRPLTVSERRSLPGLAPERADVILAGAELLQETMSFLGYTSAKISDRGVRWGLFYEKFCS